MLLLAPGEKLELRFHDPNLLAHNHVYLQLQKSETRFWPSPVPNSQAHTHIATPTHTCNYKINYIFKNISPPTSLSYGVKIFLRM